VTIGYGYAPLRVLWWAALLFALGWVLFALADMRDVMLPTSEAASGQKFRPYLYCLDALFPFGALGQLSRWTGDGSALGTLVSVATPVLRVSGWVLLSLVAVGLTNAIKRE
jgi:hypothetical protein